MSEAQLLFASVLFTAGYLIFRVLEAGLLGTFSAKYFAWAGRTSERDKLELALNAEKPTLHFRPPTTDGEAKMQFQEVVDRVPVDEATGEAIIDGPLYAAWIKDMRATLANRACDAIVTFRLVDVYFRDTFCKMTQGLASNRAWREAEEAKVTCEHEFQEIAEWASKLKKGWNEKIFPECVKIIDMKQRQQMEQQHREEERIAREMQEKQREKTMGKFKASEAKFASKMQSSGGNGDKPSDASEAISEDAAKAAEAELLKEELEAKKASSKKRAGKGKA